MVWIAVFGARPRLSIRSESKLGSFSMAIARDSRCITMLAKDPREVTMLRVSRSNVSKYIADAALY
jgi:hypothetical protein